MVKHWSYIKQLIEMPEWQGVAMLWRPNAETTLLALGAEEWVGFESREKLHDMGKWWFGYLQYDLKNNIESLSSKHDHPMGFEDLKFFSPKVVLAFKNEGVEVLHDASRRSWQPFADEEMTLPLFDAPKWHALESKAHYLNAVNQLKQHIQLGDIYEVNYCTTFEAHYPLKNGFDLFRKLNFHTEAPFSCYLKMNEIQVLCASPESFIEKQGNKLYSRPIKGTVRRGKSLAEDEELKLFLKNDVKEKAENVMIVDLVRNDLSRIAAKNSVTVEELFGIYSFKTVHHMISTVSCAIKEGILFWDILKATFPMGSMTGAPKISAMRHIDAFECANRGLYSGAMGVIQPNGDFDFNVVIRTLLYDEKNHLLRCSVGGAITALCDAEKEYEECLLKGRAVMQWPFE